MIFPIYYDTKKIQFKFFRDTKIFSGQLFIFELFP